MKIDLREKEENKVKNPLPPIDRKVHLLLKEYCLRKTREKNRLVTLGEVLEEIILNYIKRNSK